MSNNWRDSLAFPFINPDDCFESVVTAMVKECIENGNAPAKSWFVKRHMAQARSNREKLWDPKKKKYSRRGLALVAWAYNPKKSYRRNESEEDNSNLWALGAVAAFAAWWYWKKLCCRSIV